MSASDDQLHTVQEIAALIGVPPTVVRRWLDRGTLRIPRAVLVAFLEDPHSWSSWSPDHIPDVYLRHWARRLRRDAPTWLSVAQVAALLHVAPKTVSSWI